ncbi:hypothetical protein Bca4012_024413 [Brassica carinata]
MATTSSTGKTKLDNQNLSRSRSLGRKPKPVVPSSEPEASADGSGRKPVEKPLPNYLKPTISSRPDPVKFMKKNNAVEDKLLRRRSFDRPPSSLTSPSTSPSQKYLNTSPPACMHTRKTRCSKREACHWSALYVFPWKQQRRSQRKQYGGFERISRDYRGVFYSRASSPVLGDHTEHDSRGQSTQQEITLAAFRGGGSTPHNRKLQPMDDTASLKARNKYTDQRFWKLKPTFIRILCPS